jgi:hypothetical protein
MKVLEAMKNPPAFLREHLVLQNFSFSTSTSIDEIPSPRLMTNK